MSSRKTKFGDKEVDKKEFYLSKQAIFLNSVDLSKIVDSSKWKISDTKYKYFCGYLNNDVVQTLCVILPQMHVDVSSFAIKANLAALKTEVDETDIDKLKTAPVDLAKLTNSVENDLVKKKLTIILKLLV